jgi:serine phosphatase RsbU (regulator of sigma subunit)
MTASQSPPSESTYQYASYFTSLKRGLLVSSLIALIILIPRATEGIQLKALLITLGSSYSIGITSISLIWLMLRWSIPLAQRRGWPILRGWSLASLVSGLIANTVYSFIFAFIFVEPAKRGQFLSFWVVFGVILSVSVTAFFYAAERVQRELAQGRVALRRNAALDKELQLARTIQEQLLPAAPPIVAGLTLAGGCYPAREVGGDLLSYQEISDGRMCISVGDVTGKSVGAAMLMGVTLGALQAEIHDHEAPAYVLNEVDRWLRSKNQGNRFVALSIALLDPGGKTMTFANAGQLAPLIRRGQRVQFIEVPVGLPLGMGPDSVHVQETSSIETNDLLLFYTDGVVEAQNQAGEMWGFERLVRLLEAAAQEISPAELVSAIRGAVETHAAGVEQHDDITLVVVRVD